jgi:hypothetical protein
LCTTSTSGPQSSREHLVKDDPDRVEVGSIVDAAVHAACLFRGDVGQNVGDHLWRVDAFVRARDLGLDAEAGNLELAARVDEDVVRAQITVDETRRVHRGKAFGERGREIENLADRQLARRARGEDRREIAAAEVLEDDGQIAGELLYAAHPDQARRGEAGEAFALVLEARDLGVRRSLHVQDLQQDRDTIVLATRADQAEMGGLIDRLAQRVRPPIHGLKRRVGEPRSQAYVAIVGRDGCPGGDSIRGVAADVLLFSHALERMREEFLLLGI